MMPHSNSSAPLDQDFILPFDDPTADRRSFLRAMGFGVAASTMASCSRGPQEEIIPWMTAPEGVVAGRPYFVATTCGACTAGCGVIATCKDGRPTKLEGNPKHPLGRGSLCAMGQASILELYDSHRFRGPMNGTNVKTWVETERALLEALENLRSKSGGVRILTGTENSPSTLLAIEKFLSGFKNARHDAYDPLSASAILKAHELSHGVRVLPRYRLDVASLIVSFDADFLGTWISPVEYAKAWSERRRSSGPVDARVRHWHFEAGMTVSGGRADVRRRLAPDEMGPAIDFLLAAIRGESRESSSVPHAEELLDLARALKESREHSLVLCGQNDVAVQTRVNEINSQIGAYGTTIDLQCPSYQRRGHDAALEELRRDLDSGSVDLLIVQGVNPAYDHPELLGTHLSKAGLLITCASVPDETSALAHWICPEPHFLERWHDNESVAGVISTSQPASPRLVDARTLRETLSRLTGNLSTDRELVRATLETRVFPRFKEGGTFRRWHRHALHEGFHEFQEAPPALPPRSAAVLPPLRAVEPLAASEYVLRIQPKVAIQDGRHAHNPWLQELADPVSRLAWEGEATLSPRAAAELGVVEGDVLDITAKSGGSPISAPVHILPGQHDRVIVLPAGYGRAGTERFADLGPRWLQAEPTLRAGERLGVSAQGFGIVAEGCHRTDCVRVHVARTGRRVELATVQDYRSQHIPKHLAPPGGEVRDAVLATTVEKLLHDEAHAIPRPHHAQGNRSVWTDDHATSGPSFGLVVDLANCTGCSACVLACQAENNVPVVGRDEVRRHREMSWIRIDRYETGDGDDASAQHQPMMCQHCGNAPCESVCPVLATVHSEDGMNQQVYNRCVGTRYCANTCPYKVRRFNWFDYPHEDALENLVLNPNVTVRTRGVMEKCSLCVQRIQEARLEARRLGRPVQDGEIKTACQQTCPTSAIVFGDRNDPKAALSLRAASPRSYRVLEELHVEPAVRYLADIRNPIS